MWYELVTTPAAKNAASPLEKGDKCRNSSAGSYKPTSQIEHSGDRMAAPFWSAPAERGTAVPRGDGALTHGSNLGCGLAFLHPRQSRAASRAGPPSPACRRSPNHGATRLKIRSPGISTSPVASRYNSALTTGSEQKVLVGSMKNQVRTATSKTMLAE